MSIMIRTGKYSQDEMESLRQILIMGANTLECTIKDLNGETREKCALCMRANLCNDIIHAVEFLEHKINKEEVFDYVMALTDDADNNSPIVSDLKKAITINLKGENL